MNHAHGCSPGLTFRDFFFSKIAKFKGAPLFKLLIHEIVAKVAKFCSGGGVKQTKYFFLLH